MTAEADFSLPDLPPVTPSAGFTDGVLTRVRRHRRIRRVQRTSLTMLLLAAITGIGLQRRPVDPSNQVAHARTGVNWLLKAQTGEGNWRAEDWGGHPSFTPGVSALATLALLHAPEPVSDSRLNAALGYLEQQVAQNPLSRFQGPEVYNLLLSVNTLLEAEALSPDPDRLALLRSTLASLVRRQQPGGGWGYAEDQPMGYGSLQRDNANSAITWWVCHLLIKAEGMRVPGSEQAVKQGEVWLATQFQSADHIAYQDNARALAAPKDALYWMAVQSRRGISGQVDRLLPPDAYRDVLRVAALEEPRPPEEVVRSAGLKGLRRDDRWWKAGGQVYVTAATVISMVPRGGV